MSRHEYEKQFGNKYRRPRLLVRVLSFVYTLMPRIGPFKYLSFKPPTPEAEQLFLASFRQAKDRFRDSLEELRAGTLNLQNTDFDTGRATARGEYRLADETYAELVKILEKRQFANVSAALRSNITRFYGPSEAASR